MKSVAMMTWQDWLPKWAVRLHVGVMWMPALLLANDGDLQTDAVPLGANDGEIHDCLKPGQGCIFSSDQHELNVSSMALGDGQFLMEFSQTETILDDTVSELMSDDFDPAVGGQFYCLVDGQPVYVARLQRTRNSIDMIITFERIAQSFGGLSKDTVRLHAEDKSLDQVAASLREIRGSERELRVNRFETRKKSQSLYGFESLATEYAQRKTLRGARNGCGFLKRVEEDS